MTRHAAKGDDVDGPHEHTDGAARWRWSRRAALTAVSLIATGILKAGCGGSTGGGVASVGRPTTPATKSSSSGGSTVAQALKYAACMRSHGIADFPDPNAEGGFALSAGTGSDLNLNNPRFKAAERACASLRAAVLGSSTQLRQKNYNTALEYAACMRSHGVLNFPDPEAATSGANTGSSPGSGQSNSGSGGLNQNSPQFISANKACERYLPASIQRLGSGSGQ
jgi:hypothetical protein